MKSVAVIGLGNIATRHRKNLKQLFPAVTLYAMSASGRAIEQRVSNCDQVVANIEDLIKHSPEMVIVASPAPLHAKHAVALIRAGIPTLIEKPVTATVKDAVDLQTIQAATATPVMVGYCLRYLSSGIEMKRLLQQQVVGDVYNIFIQVGQYLPDWRPNTNYENTVSANKHLGGGALLELSHELDYAQWLLGDLQLEYSILRSSKELGLDVEDMADIILTTGQGAVCNIHLDMLQRSPQRSCSIIGTKGRLDWDLIKNTISFSGVNGNEVLYSEPGLDKNTMYINMLIDFVAKIQGNANQCIELAAAGRTVALIEAIKLTADVSH